MLALVGLLQSVGMAGAAWDRVLEARRAIPGAAATALDPARVDPCGCARVPAAQPALQGTGPASEYFVLELLPASAGDPLLARSAGVADDARELPPQVVGWAVCRRAGSGASHQLEWDVRLPAHETRLLHVERSDGRGGHELIWREIRPGGGRTLRAAASAVGDELQVREWTGRDLLREGVAGSAGALLPLEVLERIRQGAGGGDLLVFDPMTRGVERQSLRELDLAAEPTTSRPEPLRVVESLRTDGTIAGRFLLSQEALIAFQWQAGRLRGRRVDEATFEAGLNAVDGPPPR